MMDGWMKGGWMFDQLWIKDERMVNQVWMNDG
jgi:hypothetical protein